MKKLCQPRLFGIYKGVVRDREDPEKMGRLRIEVPSVLDRLTNWALPCAKLKDEFDIPKINTPVWVLFQGGEASLPVWLPGWLTKQGTENGLEFSEIQNYPNNSFDGIKTIKRNNLIIEFFSEKNDQQNNDILLIRDLRNQSWIKLSSEEGIEINSEYPITLSSPKNINLNAGKIVSKVSGNDSKAILNNLNRSVANNASINIGNILNMIIAGNMNVQGGEDSELNLNAGLTEATKRGLSTNIDETKIQHQIKNNLESAENHLNAAKNKLGQNPTDVILLADKFLNTYKDLLELLKNHTHPSASGPTSQSVELQTLIPIKLSEAILEQTKSTVNEVQ